MYAICTVAGATENDENVCRNAGGLNRGHRRQAQCAKGLRRIDVLGRDLKKAMAQPSGALSAGSVELLTSRLV